VFDVGLPELLVIALVGLLIFGPDRLPNAITQASAWLRQLREMAAQTRQEISDSMGPAIDDSALTDAMKDLRDLHPKRLVSGLLDDPDVATNGSRTANGSSATPGATKNASSHGGSPNSTTGSPTTPSPTTGSPTTGSPTTYDPDAT